MASLTTLSQPCAVRESSPSPVMGKGPATEGGVNEILHCMKFMCDCREGLDPKGQAIMAQVNNIFESARTSFRPLSDLEKTRVVNFAKNLALSGTTPVTLKKDLMTRLQKLDCLTKDLSRFSELKAPARV